jgi:hypothetical protein
MSTERQTGSTSPSVGRGEACVDALDELRQGSQLAGGVPLDLGDHLLHPRLHRALPLSELVLVVFHRGVHLQVALVHPEEVEWLE